MWGVQKFQKYLYGKEFVVETDHQPLRFLQSAQLKNSRVLRWAMALQLYRYQVKYIPGRDNLQQDLADRRIANPMDPVLNHHTSQERQPAAMPELPNNKPHQSPKQSHAEGHTE